MGRHYSYLFVPFLFVWGLVTRRITSDRAVIAILAHVLAGAMTYVAVDGMSLQKGPKLSSLPETVFFSVMVFWGGLLVYGALLGWVLGFGRPDSSDSSVIRGSRFKNDDEIRSWNKSAKTGNPIWLGKSAIHPDKEPQHFLVAGRTGAGKTQVIYSFLEKARERAQAGIAADLSGIYLSRFYRDGDTVLSLFDRRSVAWSPFNEIRAPYDAMLLAESFIPRADDGSDDKQWQFYAQTLLGELLRSLHAKGDHSMAHMRRLMMSATAAELQVFTKDTAVEILCHAGNERMLANTRAIAAVYMNPWQYLPDNGHFSIRSWVANNADGSDWLFLPYRDDQASLVRNLLAGWIDLAVTEALRLPEDPGRRFWYLMDELDSLGKLGSLKAATTKLRKYGGVVVGGIQTVSQLEATYGEKTAQTILGSLSNKIILAAGDGATATYFETELGKQTAWVSSHAEGSSSSFGQAPSKSYTSTRNETERSTVMASQLLSLPDLTGYLRLTGDNITPFALTYKNHPVKVTAFEDIHA